MRSLISALMLCLSLLAAPVANAADLLAELVALAPDADVEVLSLALAARECATTRGLATAGERLAVIDYARPSTEPRLWVFDLSVPKLLFVEYVAHGRGSGENRAHVFSNVEGSHQTSLGLFRTGETYAGGNGYSLRLDGLEPGINDRARERAIVMHGAAYVDPELAKRQGRLGRSFGYPAVRQSVARPMIDALKEGQLLFAYSEDRDWRASSALLTCGSAGNEIAVADVPAAAASGDQVATAASIPAVVSTRP